MVSQEVSTYKVIRRTTHEKDPVTDKIRAITRNHDTLVSHIGPRFANSIFVKSSLFSDGSLMNMIRKSTTNPSGSLLLGQEMYSMIPHLSIYSRFKEEKGSQVNVNQYNGPQTGTDPKEVILGTKEVCLGFEADRPVTIVGQFADGSVKINPEKYNVISTKSYSEIHSDLEATVTTFNFCKYLFLGGAVVCGILTGVNINRAISSDQNHG